MLTESRIPWLLGGLLVPLLAMLTWRLWHLRRGGAEGRERDAGADTLLWVAVLAGFALGAFLTYGLLGYAWAMR